MLCEYCKGLLHYLRSGVRMQMYVRTVPILAEMSPLYSWEKREGRRLLAKSIFKVLGYSGKQRSQYVMILRLCFGMEALQSRRPSGPLWRVSWCLLKSIFDAELTGTPVEVCFLASAITLTDRNDTELRFCAYVSYSYRRLNALNLLYQIDIDYILRFKLRAQI